MDTTTIYTGVTSLEFRAAEMGAVTPTIGTITNIVTITDGITSVINNVGYTTLGVEQESNYDFRIRRDHSTGASGGNSEDAILGQILALSGVNDCRVWVNSDSTTDSTGTLPHYIWVIADGGANTDIADIIYSNKGGCGTRGNITVPIATVSAQTININFDRPTILPLFIKFDLYVVGEIGEINQEGIKEYIAENLLYEISESVETSKITTVAAQAIEVNGGGAYALNVEVSTGGTATASVSGTGITDATVDPVMFQSMAGNLPTGNYVFTYSSEGWQYDGGNASIEDYGITVVGTPEIGDTVTIAYTAAVWTDYIPIDTLADKYTTDASKIYMNIVEE